MNVCTLVWEGDCGNAALYGADGKKIAEYDESNNPNMDASDIYGNDCEVVHVRQAHTEGETCRIYHWSSWGGHGDAIEWDAELVWPEELGDEAWLNSATVGDAEP